MRAFIVLLLGVAAFAAEPSAPSPVPITIDQALELLRRNSPALQAARAGVDAARAGRDIASRIPNPTVTVGVDSLTVPAWRRPNDQGPEASVELEQLLESGGKRRWRTAAAAALEGAAVADAAEAARQQELALHQSFWGAVLAREQGRLTAEDLASIAQSEALLRERVAAGAIAEGDLLRFQASAVPFQQAALAAELAYAGAIRALVSALAGAAGPGLPAVGFDSTLVPVGELTAALPELSRDELLRRARSRPDVLAAERQIEAAQASLRLARAQRVPDVTLGLGGAREGETSTVSVSAAIELPVFDSYAPAVLQAEARRRQAEALARQALASALAEADQAWLAYDSARRLLAVYDHGAVERARDALAATETAYREGAVDLVAVLEARRTYGQTRAAWLQALYDVRIGAASAALLGGGGGGGAHAAAPAGGGAAQGGGDD